MKMLFPTLANVIKAFLIAAVCVVAVLARADNTPIHDYKFTEIGGTNFADSIGGAAWTGTLPNGGSLVGNQLILTSASSQYGKLPAGIVSTLTNFTIAAWVNLNSSANWARLFDFGNNTTTYMFLAPQNGSSGTARYAITTSSSGGEQQINGPSALTTNAWHFVTVTLNGTTGILYVDGAPVGTNSSMTLNPASLGSTTNNYLGKSQWSDPYLNASLDEFSIYNVALSSDQITNLYAQGYSVLASQPAAQCAINWADTQQRIDGFGFSSAWCGTLSAAKNNALYGTLGMSLLRIRIDENMNWTPEIANAAAAHAAGVKVLGSPWFAPSSMTYRTTNVTATATNILTWLQTNSYSAYALWLGKAATNHNLDWVSFQNEPDYSAWMQWTAPQMLTFLKSNAPAIGKPIVAPESFHFNDSWSDPMLNDPVAATNLAIVGGHFYGGGNYVHTNALAHGKPVWMTEHYLDGGTTNFPVCLNFAKEINDAMNNQFSAYIAWWAQDGDTNINLANSSGTILKDGYTMGQFAKFIRPGFYRVGAASTGTPVEFSAYKDALSSNYVIVALNRGSSVVTQQFNLFGFPTNSAVTPWLTSWTQSLTAQAVITNVGSTFTYSIQPSNIVTFVGTVPPLAPANLTATAGKNKISLNWSATTGASSYNIKRATVSGGPYGVLTNVASTSFSDTNIVAGTRYYYVVSAMNVSGESANSAETTAKAVQFFSIYPLADSYVESSTASSNYGTSTNMLVKNNVTLATRNAYLMFDVHALTNVQTATVTLVPNRVDDTTVKMLYEVASTNWTEMGITWNNQPGGTGNYFFTNTLNVGTPVVLDVANLVASQATNGGLFSFRITQPTNNQNGLIQFCSKEHPTNSWRPVLEYSLNDTNVPPPAPVGLTATVSNTSVSLTWTTSAGATNYNVKRSFTSGSGYTTLAGVADTNFVDTGLAYGTYYYVVSALNGSGESSNSTEASAIITVLPAPISVTNAIGATVTIASNGFYSVSFVLPPWTFAGNLAQNLTNRTVNTGVDSIGAYFEITFNYTSAVAHVAAIRLYNNSPVVTFGDTTLTAGVNDLAFPRLTSYPMNLSHISFMDTFSVFNFAKLYEPWAPCDNLLLYFNTNHDAFAISAASNYPISSIWTNGDGSISCGINSGIMQLPAGFTHRFILTAQNGINQTYSTWGNALMTLGGKTPPANDATIELNKLGYWTDNGAAYYPYYNGTAPGIANTLLSVKSEFAGLGIPISYMQLDSWWYKKGTNAVWNDPNSGFYLYEADPYLFTNGLTGFQQQLGLPLIVHNRWVDTNSPYITQSNWTWSGGVMIDPRFWTNLMDSIKSSGVITYEQDWLNYRGVPNMNLTDPPAFLNNMAWAAAADGINLQYCMVQGRDYLQATLFTNVITIRTSEDRFDTTRWAEHLYGSRLAQAVGIWPWTDVCMSSETRNVLLQALSAGPVGPGDALGTENPTNLLKVVRPDGVIVKPDVPLVPTDDTYVNDALGLGKPFIATTCTDHTNSLALYVFSYGENASQLTNNFRPADFGLTNSAYVYDYFAATGMVVSAGGTFSFTTTLSNVFTDGSYFIAVPVGPSGLALVGDTGKFVTRGKKRISQVTDNGLLTATVKFASGEAAVTLLGYSPSYPSIAFSQGSGGIVSYNPGTKVFTANIVPDGTATATVQFGTNGTPPPPPAAPATLAAESVNSSQIKLSWSASSGVSGYNLKRGISSGGPYTNVASTTATSFSDTGLTAGMTYYYVVTAFNGGGESANSPQASASTVPVLSVEPVADAYVRDGSSASVNFGSATNLAVKYDGTIGDGFNRYTYLKFDVHALTNLLSAKLILTPIQVDGIGNLAYEQWSNDTWDESTITWNNQPTGSGTTITNIANYTLFTPTVVDVTTAAMGQVTNDGLLTIRVTQPGANATRIDFCSREHPTNSWHPVLQYAINNNTAPTLTVGGSQTIGVGVTLNVTNSASDSDVPAQTLTFSLLSAPTNAFINPSAGVVTWKPLVTQANTTNVFVVRVADSGTPSMSATQSFVVMVKPITLPQVSGATADGGQLVLQVNGDDGPDYQVQSSTNLVNWTPVFTTNSPAMPFVWATSVTNGSLNFFRILVGPPF